MQQDFELKKDMLTQRLRRAILSGEYPHGSKLPVEVELARQLAVSRDTLRAALKVLESESLLVRQRSKGTFVSNPVDAEGRVLLVLSKAAHAEDISSASHYLLPGLQRAALASNLEIELCPLEYLSSLPAGQAAQELKRRTNLAGCVIFEGRYNGHENYIQALQQSGLPVVMAVCHENDVRVTGFAGVRVDQKAAWISGILALKESGHRRIATVTAPSMQGFNEDFDSYYDFLRREGIYDETLIRVAPYRYEEIAEALRSLMELREPPTAVMCFSDFYAMHLLRAAAAMRICIPRDLSVLGYCGFPGGKFLSPSLGTVDFHYRELGEKVVEMIVRASEWHRPDVAPPEIIMPHEVVLRESAAIRKVESLFTPNQRSL